MNISDIIFGHVNTDMGGAASFFSHTPLPSVNPIFENIHNFSESIHLGSIIWVLTKTAFIIGIIYILFLLSKLFFNFFTKQKGLRGLTTKFIIVIAISILEYLIIGIVNGISMSFGGCTPFI